VVIVVVKCYPVIVLDLRSLVVNVHLLGRRGLADQIFRVAIYTIPAVWLDVWVRRGPADQIFGVAIYTIPAVWLDVWVLVLRVLISILVVGVLF
jgi:hypothetical protein